MYLKDKNILLGVTASVAIYKSLELIRLLQQEGALVRVIMTPHATKFISPQLFEAVSQHSVFVHQFDLGTSKKHASYCNFVTKPHFSDDPKVAYPHLESADLVLIAPATANFLGKIASGIADDLLTTTVLATDAPKVIAPAMNVNMWQNPIVQSNVEKLKRYGYHFADPSIGILACGDVGVGRLADLDAILQLVFYALAPKDFLGKRVLITAGPTCEHIDDVRFLSNASSGKMGYALAREAWIRGACVTIISGPVHLNAPSGVTVDYVRSAEEMYQSVLRHFLHCDVFISAAAVSDYRLSHLHRGKLKKQESLNIQLVETMDIIREMCRLKQKDQMVIGFALEDNKPLKNVVSSHSFSKVPKKSENIIAAKGYEKLLDKGLDMIVANGLETLGSNSAHVQLITRKRVVDIPQNSKEAVARQILNGL